jgi:hypothetical protein
MSDEIELLKSRLCAVEEEIKETEKRIPAHSVKPPVMEDLFHLEDEKALLIQKIKAFK